MALRIVRETAEALPAFDRIPMTFLVTSRLRAEAVDGGFDLTEEPVAEPWTTDYDANEDERPSNLPKRYDVAKWGIIAAFDGDERVGGVIVAPATDAWHSETGAELTNIRVAPEQRRKGAGFALFLAAVAWAREQGCSELVIETQDVNVAANRFYEAMGCKLFAVNEGAYPDVPEEAQHLWRLPL